MTLPPQLYAYNNKNQLIEASATEDVFNAFNAEGQRASKKTGGTTTYYTYEYDKVVKEHDTNGVSAYNVYGTNLISRDVAGQKVYYLYNGHGDVTGLVSSSGTIIASYYYDAFGNIVEQSGNFSNPYRYSSYVYDEESRLYNLNARFYDASIARFMQEDTYLGNRSDPLSLNLYTYCHNNPLIYHDPTGHVVSAADKANLSYSQQYSIQVWTDRYERAKATGNTAAMANAHAKAEAIRATAGYSGSSNGSTYIPITPTGSSGSSNNSSTRQGSNSSGSSSRPGSNSSSSSSYYNSNSAYIEAHLTASINSPGLIASSSQGSRGISPGSVKSIDYIPNLVEWLVRATIDFDEDLYSNIIDYVASQNPKRTSEIIGDIDPNARIIINTKNKEVANLVIAEMQKLTNDTLMLGEAGYANLLLIDQVRLSRQVTVVAYPVYIETRKNSVSKPGGTELIRALADANNRTIIEHSKRGWGRSYDSEKEKDTQNGVGTDAYVRFDFNNLPELVERAFDLDSRKFLYTLRPVPVEIAFGHEFIHAMDTVTGKHVTGYVTYTCPLTGKDLRIIKSEAVTVGFSYKENGEEHVPSKQQITENKLRKESKIYNQRAYYDTNDYKKEIK